MIKTAIKHSAVRFAVRGYIRKKRRRLKDNYPVRERMNIRMAEMLLEAYSRRRTTILSGFFFPAELAHAYGVTPLFTESIAAITAGSGFGVRALETAEARGHSRDGCSFHRVTLGAALNDYLPKLKLVVATSHLCDGQNKALEELAEHCRAPYFLLDVPQENNEASVDYLAGQLGEIESQMARITGSRATSDDWKRIFALSNKTRELMIRVNELRRARPSPMFGKAAFNTFFQALLMFGTAFLHDCYRDLETELKEKLDSTRNDGERFRIIWLLSYPYFRGNFTNYLEKDLGIHAVAEELSVVHWSPLDPQKPVRSLARRILENPQLGPVTNRIGVVENLVRDYSADGVIHFSHWGCRQGCGGVRPIRDALARINVPFLELDGDCIDDRNYSEGQTRTRLEGFVELMEKKKGKVNEIKVSKDKLYLGIDIGSLSAEAVVIDGSGRIVSQEIVLTGASSRRAAERLREGVFENGDFDGKIAACVATGYGRGAVDYADKQITEISCHARGIAHQLKGVRTIVDIGGQDTKAIAVEPDGAVTSFVMNDKCAAGTGRFVEVMARTLEIDLEDFGPYALRAGRSVTISSMCTVFAESEVVSLIAEGLPEEEIARGVCDSIASRTSSLLERVGRKQKVAMSGGVAKNVGVVKALERILGFHLVLPAEPQTIGALGAALIARDLDQ